MQITTAAQAAERDADAIASGIDSFSLMTAAGVAAAQHIVGLANQHMISEICVWAGTGNNGGDAYVVATALLKMQRFKLTLWDSGEPKTADAARAKALYLEAIEDTPPQTDGPGWGHNWQQEDPGVLFVDGLLGTGQRGPLRGRERELATRFNQTRAENWRVVALDVPTGLNATTGEIVEHAVRADYTLAFGTAKRAHILQREFCGEVRILDIGLGAAANKSDGAWTLVDEKFVADRIPRTPVSAHKGTRARIGILGGAKGMAGAVTLASEAALRSGAGLVHAFVAEESVLPLQIAVPQALAHARDALDLETVLRPMDALVIGPGFGRDDASARLLDGLVECLTSRLTAVPLLLDADALTLLASKPELFRSLASNRSVVCTPHPGEFARLLGAPVASALDARIDQARTFADSSRCIVLLKGTPTVVVAPDTASVLVVPRGTPVLATGGSGDMLSGIIGTLLAQGLPGDMAGAAGALIHGLTAEFATRDFIWRGMLLSDVMQSMPAVWKHLTALRTVPGTNYHMAALLSTLPLVHAT
ncbi:MAG: NAD(P)H-hydrate dehydratase [Gemmatimonas sp.]